MRKHQSEITSRVSKLIPIVLASLLGMLCVSNSAIAQLTLSDQNTTIHITTNSSAGMDSWTVDGQNVLDQQWFWYRVGNSGAQASLDTLPATYTFTDAADLTATYTGATFLVTAKFSLLGGLPASGTSDLGIQFRVTNTSGSAETFHFFEYSNFTLGLSGSDIVQFQNSNSVFQTGSLGSVTETNNAVVTGGSGFPAPMHYEANVVPNTLTSLTSSNNYFLNGATSATGDVTWAFQWDLPINAGASSQFSKDISVQVPEPGTVSLVVAGFAGLCLWRRRKS
jgi:hypothetical protein